MNGPGRIVAASAAAFVLAVAGVLLAPVLRDPAADSRTALGYVEAMRIVIDNGWVVAGSGGRVVEVSEEGRTAPEAAAFRTFYAHSFLADDIARNDPGLWLIDSVLIGASPFAHVSTSPFAGPGWQGDLTAAQTPGGIELVTSAGAALRLEPQALGAPDASVSLDVFAAAPSRGGSLMRLYGGSPEAGRPHLGDVRLIGSTPILTVRAPAGGIEAELDGRALAAGGAWPLGPGSRLVFRRGSREAVVTVRGGTGGALSVAQPLGGRRRNPRLEALAQGFEAAMDAVVAKAPEARERSFVSTLDLDAHLAVQDRLERTMAGAGAPAAITVMDALSGEVLVLASTPARSALGPIAAPSASLRDRNVLNYNFQPLAAGSTVKPLIAAAILAETPGLAELTVRHQGAGPMERVLGVGFHGDPRSWPREVAGAAPGEWLTVERFLSRSSNRYAASLALLGWAPDPLAANGFPAGGDHALGGPPAERLPMLDVQLQQGADGPGFGPALRAPRWRRHLASLFDTGACRGPDFCDNSPWGPVFLGLPTVDGARPPTQFLAISPQDQDFRFGEMQDFRTQYLPVILGGEAYGWSALRLAQSYARLTTGRLVQARLVRDPRGQPASFGALPLDAGVRARLLAGLEQVVSEGTGAPLRPVLAELQAEAARRGETVRLYAKTGTPEIERLAYSAQEEAENRLIAARLITLDGGLVRIRGVAPRDEADRAEAVARLRADRAAMRLLGPSGRPAAAVGRALAFNRARPSARFGYYRAVQGRLTAVSPRGAADSHFVSALALVVVVSRPGAAEPERAIAVTLNLQEPGRAAAPLAAEMLRGELWPIVFPVRGREARR